MRKSSVSVERIYYFFIDDKGDRVKKPSDFLQGETLGGDTISPAKIRWL